jgi:glycosyltransferase involved in cell wall biosynthesis
MKKLVYVTQELSPFTAGGIGRVLHNIFKSLDPKDSERIVLINLGAKIPPTLFSKQFPRAVIINADISFDVVRDAQMHYPPRAAYKTKHQWLSFLAMTELRKLASKFAIDYVEFPDWGGLGFSTIQENIATGFLQGATIAVRLHSTHAVLCAYESYNLSLNDCLIMDIERKSLRDCDMIIAQIEQVSIKTCEIFDFQLEEWEKKIVIHAPPVLIDFLPEATESHIPNKDTALVFGSKLQEVKRPDIFVRGSNSYFAKNPDSSTQVIFAAHSFDTLYREKILTMIAPNFREKFHMNPIDSLVLRESIISKSVFVVPGEFESFCLAAYEASILGALVVLNAKNPAFSSETTWKNGLNCLKYDGTVDGLAAVIDIGLNSKINLEIVQIPKHKLPWELTKRADEIYENSDIMPLVSVILTNFNLAGYLPMTLDSVLNQTYENVEILLIDDCSTEESSIALINQISSRKIENLRVIRCEYNRGLAGARNLGIFNSKGDFILTLDADDLLHPRAIEHAVLALQKNPLYDLFVFQVGRFQLEHEIPFPGDDRLFSGYITVHGEAFYSGTIDNFFSSSCAMFRRNVFQDNSYREELQVYEDWAMFLELTFKKHRFIVSNHVLFYYRDRVGSMVKATYDPVYAQRARHEVMRRSGPKEKQSLAFVAALAVRSGELQVISEASVTSFKALRALQLITEIKFRLTYPIRRLRRRYRFRLHEIARILEERSA